MYTSIYVYIWKTIMWSQTNHVKYNYTERLKVTGWKKKSNRMEEDTICKHKHTGITILVSDKVYNWARSIRRD